MEVTCPACAARYTADDEKLRGKTARMRCRQCETVWLVGGDDDPLPSERRAAVVRRGAERERADLFAARPSDHGMVSPTIPPPGGGGACVGARNENSVLFTLNALKGSSAARVKTPAPEPSPISSRRPEDDEGIIDLNALKSVPPKSAARPMMPVFSSDPPPAFARDVGASYPPTEERKFPLKVKTAGVVAAAAIGVVLLVIGIASAFKGEEPVARTAAPPPPPPAVVTPPPPAPTADPAPSASASSASDDSKGPKKAKGFRGVGGGGKGGGVGGAPITFKKGQSDSTPAAAPKPPPPVKAADPCGCHGDFNCILRCTAKGK
jgi:predicted Zn finger-like uncharacterized protein